MPDIIGIAGRARSGKDTVAEYIRPFGYRRRAFADEIKFVASVVYGLDDQQMNDPELKDEPLDEWDGLTPRQILQRLGTEVGRNIHEQTWIKALFRWIDDHWEIQGGVKGYVIPDVRFLNEAQAIKDRGGSIWFVECEANNEISGEGHESEAHFDELRDMADIVIENDDGYDELHQQIYEAMSNE